ncbi:MAG: filamentous hemagglutinin N-terminal domain-containing protein [Cyanobacteria bacterium P01_D01_bin.44]
MLPLVLIETLPVDLATPVGFPAQAFDQTAGQTVAPTQAPADSSMLPDVTPEGGISTLNQPSFSSGARPDRLAQAITPADTGTVVTPIEDQIDITGGQLSGDGANLFHSFEQFGLSADQTANFIATPQIQNVLGRIVGGDASVIDGVLRLSNSDANLFLINPAGILFGPNARLNLPASFTATTADSVGFGEAWFNATGTADYAALSGTPAEFAFYPSDPGSLVNLGQLAISEGESLSLLGGRVVNTGELSAPEGTVTVAAVPGENIVRLTQDDRLLSLELQPVTVADEENTSTVSLAELLTGGSLETSDIISANPDGTIQLIPSETVVPTQSGTAVVGGTVETAGTIGGEINVLGARVALIDSTLNASGVLGGGNVRIGGGYQGRDTVPNASHTYADSLSTINVDAGQTGEGGQTILWADDVTQFYGNVSARGGFEAGDGGFVEVSGKNNLIFEGAVDLTAPAGQVGQLLLDPNSVVIGVNGVDDAQLDDGDIFATDAGATFFISAAKVVEILDMGDVEIAAISDIRVDEAIDVSGNSGVSNLTLTAGEIELNDSIRLNGGDIVFEGAVLLNFDNTDTFAVVLDTGDSSGDIRFNSTLNSDNDAEFRRLEISAAGDVSFDDTIGSLRDPNVLNISAENVTLADYQGDNLTVFARENLIFQPQQNTTLDGSIRLTAGNELTLLAAGNLSLVDAELQQNNPSGSLNLRAQTLDITNNSQITALGELTAESQTISSVNSQISAGGDLILQGLDNLSTPNITLTNSQLNADGNLWVRGSETSSAGNIGVINSQLEAGSNLSLTGQSLMVTPGSQIEAAEDVTLLATPGTVAIADAVGQPILIQAGEELMIEGNSEIDIQALSSPQSVLRSGGNLSLISNGNITANGRFVSGGDFSAGPGSLLYTPISANGIISSVGDVSFGDYTGSSLKIESGGSIQGGEIEITDPDISLSGTDPDIAFLSSGPALILRAGLAEQQNTPPSSNEFQNTPNLAPGDATNREGTIFTANASAATGNIEVGNISTNAELDEVGSVILSATGEISTGDITTAGIGGGSVELSSVGNIETGNISADGDDSSVMLFSEAGNVEVATILNRGREIRISAAGTFQATDTFNVGTLVENGIETTDLPVSLALTRFDSEGMSLFYNGATSADPALSNDRISIGGNGEQFVVGPVLTGKIDPNSGEFIAPFQAGATARRNETYAPRAVPEEVSGTAGGITIGGFGTNGFLSVSVQDIPFIDEGSPPGPGAGPGPVAGPGPEPGPGSNPISGDEGTIQAREEQIDRQADASVCDAFDGDLIAQGGLRGEAERGDADIEEPSVDTETHQNAGRNACVGSDFEESILQVEQPVEPLPVEPLDETVDPEL